jgi:hypothetical protein
MSDTPRPVPASPCPCRTPGGAVVGRPWRKALGRPDPTLLSALAVAVLPKCPLCWAAWWSVAATLGLGRLPFSPFLLRGAVALLGLLLAVVVWRSWQRRQPVSAVLFVLGGVLVVGGRFGSESPPALYMGLALLWVASLSAHRGLADRRGVLADGLEK